MSHPSLSVVIPNYNHGHYLHRCLGAILNQSVQPSEIMLIDDASTDNSWEVIQELAAKYPVIRPLRNEQNRGVVFGMNRGLELAQSEYVCFPAADDQVLPGLFEKSLSTLAQHPTAALSSTIGDWHEISSGLNWQVSVGMAGEPPFLSAARLVELEKNGTLYIASHVAIMRKQAILDAGGFIPELKMHCDWFAIYVAAFRSGICFIPEVLGILNIHPKSFYTAGVKNREDYRKVLVRMLELLEEERYRDAATAIRESGALFLFGQPILQLMIGNPRYRKYLTPTFLRKNLAHLAKLKVKPWLPRFLAQWYLKRAGYRVKAS